MNDEKTLPKPPTEQWLREQIETLHQTRDDMQRAVAYLDRITANLQHLKEALDGLE